VFIVGSGSTTAFVMQTLGLDNTLLGVDLIHNQSLLCSDITEPVLWQFIQSNKNLSLKLVITLIGGQGHIFGRGNQQLSPRIIRAIGKQNIIVIATKTKLTALNSRPLIVDTGDSELDQAMSGFMPVTTGYKDQVLYPVASPE
jgi:predicted polyphosphate/ATP-dependent NAD kinase